MEPRNDAEEASSGKNCDLQGHVAPNTRAAKDPQNL
ncbi:hypothetical protein Pcac1_g14357 [Phytophthora cactorum]|nr:hypothetical protein Pcac1_g14357 [Phytophthora cactorum]